MTIQQILDRLDKVRPQSGYYMARCPAHDDTTPSLQVSEDPQTGRVTVYDHGGCDRKDILSAMGLTTSDLGGGNGKLRPEDIIGKYPFTDEEGKTLFYELRWPGKIIRYWHTGRDGQWVENIKGIRRPLYRLPELIASDPNEVIYLVEGPKDAESLAELRLTATTNPMGALKWNRDYTKSLKGRHVVILPDLDDTGRKHAANVAKELDGVAASLKVIELPGLEPPKKDITDWLALGHSKDELLGLAEKAPEYTKPVSTPVKSVVAGNVAPEPVRWLWTNRIAIGKMTLIAGDPGLGKSFISLDLAARVSRGGVMPDNTPGDTEPGRVLLISAEDDIADTIRPRLDAAKADVDRIHIVTDAAFNLVDHIDALEQTIKAIDDCRLVVIDPVSAFLGGTDSHKNAEVRGMLAPMSEMAARHGAAIIAVTHLRKGEGAAIYRAMGSLAFVAAARAGFAVVTDPADPMKQRRLFLPIKNNLGNDRTGLAFRLMTEGDFFPHNIPAVAWDAGAVETTCDEAMRPSGEAPRSTEAVDWLTAALEEGPVESKVLFARAGEDGISKITLRRAKDQIGILTFRQGYGGKGNWLWKLPAGQR